MSFLDIALSCIARGWYVFPCIPKDKKPLKGLSYLEASRDEAQVRAWWEREPNANVAIAPGKSGFTVLDCDHGFKSYEDFVAWRQNLKLPHTFTVHTGRRIDPETGEPTYNVQMYYKDAELQRSIAWEDGDYAGDIRSNTGHVMAAGSIHPDSGEVYEVLEDRALEPVPLYVRTVPPAKPKDKEGKPLDDITDDGGVIDHHRNVLMIKLLGKKRAEGATDEELRAYAIEQNDARFVPPLDERELERLIENACKFPVPEPDPIPVLNGKTPEQRQAEALAQEAAAPKTWRELFHTREEAENAKPVTFLIDHFLQCEGVTAIAAPVRQRKTLISLNIVRALLTGEALFGHFEVTRKPERVLYLVPEVSLGPFTDSVKKLQLIEYVGKTFFYRTMTKEGRISLKDPLLMEAVPGSVVFLDTARRFLPGDEKDLAIVMEFAETIFALIRGGAEAIVLLHHTPKESAKAEEMTLENMMSGSGDMGAFVACCWGTRLQDPSRPYESPSYLENLKQRDFQSRPFEVKTDAPEDPVLKMCSDPDGPPVVLRSKAKANADGKDPVATALLKAHPSMSAREASAMLKEHGVKRGKDWCSRKLAEIKGTGCSVDS